VKRILLALVNGLGLFWLFHRYTRNTATVYMLHAITGGKSGEARAAYSEEAAGALSADVLRQFLTYLRDHTYSVIPLTEWVERLRDRKSTYKTVVFTVDDGYRDFYEHAFPVFKEFGYSATIFVTSDFIEGKLFFWWDTIEYAISHTSRTTLDLGITELGVMSFASTAEKTDSVARFTKYCKTLTNDAKLALIARLVSEVGVDISGQPKGRYAPLSWSEMQEMQKGGIEFHPHTKTHPIMTRIPRAQKEIEASIPKAMLEKNIGRPANIFCYPNGGWADFDDETIDVLRKAGYIAAVTGITGFNVTTAENEMFKLWRFAIPDDLVMFKQHISGFERFKRRVLYRMDS
jgi:peptidoglycan/xylan/chitin deacetylase (PgdA/CDA1 family)